jgi:FixJ family two-component response regulator
VAELKAKLETLTPRKLEVMGLITAGLMNKQVADERARSQSRFTAATSSQNGRAVARRDRAHGRDRRHLSPKDLSRLNLSIFTWL